MPDSQAGLRKPGAQGGVFPAREMAGQVPGCEAVAGPRVDVAAVGGVLGVVGALHGGRVAEMMSQAAIQNQMQVGKAQAMRLAVAVGATLAAWWWTLSMAGAGHSPTRTRHMSGVAPCSNH